MSQRSPAARPAGGPRPARLDLRGPTPRCARGGDDACASEELTLSALTRWLPSTGLVAILVTGLVALTAPAQGLAAAARGDAVPTHAWSATTVCVESHVASEWGVRGALRRWNALDGGPRFVLEDTCAAYDDTVTVRYLDRDDRYTGWTTWYWDETGHIVHADVTVNPQRIEAFASQERTCQRHHTLTHELGHALGLRHYPRSHAGSVMSYLGWQRHCGGLSAHDQGDYAQLYPATSDVTVLLRPVS